MAVAYILAHFDDEYGATPAVLAAHGRGEAQHFLYVADYDAPQTAQVRLAETRRYLAHLGLDPDCAEHVGCGSGIMDGAVHLGLEKVYALLRDRLAALGPIDRLVTPAWEGGHVDHDACALLAFALATELGVPRVEQISLYNGAGLVGPLFHAMRPLRENGPVQRVPMSFSQVARWAADVRFFPSQAKTFLGLWPTMFLSVLIRGWGLQKLDAERVRERPHTGRLFYERMYRRPYAEFRTAADAFLDARLRLQDQHEAADDQHVAGRELPAERLLEHEPGDQRHQG